MTRGLSLAPLVLAVLVYHVSSAAGPSTTTLQSSTSTTTQAFTNMPKTVNDTKWYWYRGRSYDYNFTDSLAVCASYGLKLAYMDSTADFVNITKTFCAANSGSVFQGFIGLEWTGTSSIYEWLATNQIMDPATQLPPGQTSVDGFYCPTIACGAFCARAVVLQFLCRSNITKLYCAYQNELQRSVLCRNDDPTVTLPVNIYTQPSTVDGTLIRSSSSSSTLASPSIVTQNSPNSNYALIRLPGCGYTVTDAQALCASHDSQLAELPLSSDYDTLMSLYRPTNPNIQRMDIWVNGQYDYGSASWYWIPSGQPVNYFQDYDPSLNTSSGPTIDESMCPSSYLDMRGLMLHIRFDYNYSQLVCAPLNYNLACYALCTNATSVVVNNVSIIDQITTTQVPLTEINTNFGWTSYSQLVASSCNLTQSAARDQCSAKNLTLAFLSTQREFQEILDLFRPTGSTYALYQFWIDMQYDYDYGFYRWRATGDQVYLPSGVVINSEWCDNTGDYRGVILKLEFPFNRYYLYCMPYDVPQCYGLCMGDYVKHTTDFYRYQRNGSWSEWGAWDSCYMIHEFQVGSNYYRKQLLIDCTYIALQNETNIMIDTRNNLTTTELHEIAASTARELELLNQKYKLADTVGDTANWLAIVILAVSYVSIIMLDVSKLCIKEKLESEKEAEAEAKKKKKPVKNKKNNKKKNRRRSTLRKASMAKAQAQESSFIQRLRKMYDGDEPRTSRSRDNSIVANSGKRPSLTQDILYNVARRVSFDTKMLNMIVKPMIKVRKCGSGKYPGDTLETVNEASGRESQAMDRSNSKLTPMPNQARKGSIEAVINKIRRLSNIATAYMQPHESFIDESEPAEAPQTPFSPEDYTPFEFEKQSSENSAPIRPASKAVNHTPYEPPKASERASNGNKKREKFKLTSSGLSTAKRYVKRVSYANTKLDRPDSIVVIDK